MALAEFARSIRREPLDLPYAALLYARDIAYPGLQISTYLRRLDDLADQARTAVPSDLPLPERAAALATFLFDQAGFLGNIDHYSDERNSFLNEVLDRGLGLPITLSVIYLSVAGRLGLPAYGVSLPGHFVVGIGQGDQSEPLLLDPFHGGGRLTRQDCRRLVRAATGHRGPLRAAWLAPTASPAILVRMLNNLRLVYHQESRWEREAAAVRHLRALLPDDSALLRDEGLLEVRAGNILRGTRLLERYLTLEPHAPEADHLRRSVAAPLEAWLRLN